MRLVVRIVLIGRDRSRHSFDHARWAKNSIRLERPPLRSLWWVVLFTCLVIRAIHRVEVATDLTADQFLQALRRLLSRRGTPSCGQSSSHCLVLSSHRHASHHLHLHATPVSPGASFPPMLHGQVECMNALLARLRGVCEKPSGPLVCN